MTLDRRRGVETNLTGDDPVVCKGVTDKVVKKKVGVRQVG